MSIALATYMNQANLRRKPNIVRPAVYATLKESQVTLF